MAVEVQGSVLKFAVDGFVRLFEDGGSGGAGALAVGFDVLDEDRQALRAVAELARRASIGGELLEHDPGIAGAHLRPADGVPITKVFGETEGAGEPGNGLFEVPVPDMGDQSIGGHRAIADHAGFACGRLESGSAVVSTIEKAGAPVL